MPDSEVFEHRGRASALDVVEDDDIVNQNSSRSSSADDSKDERVSEMIGLNDQSKQPSLSLMESGSWQKP